MKHKFVTSLFGFCFCLYTGGVGLLNQAKSIALFVTFNDDFKHYTNISQLLAITCTHI